MFFTQFLKLNFKLSYVKNLLTKLLFCAKMLSDNGKEIIMEIAIKTQKYGNLKPKIAQWYLRFCKDLGLPQDFVKRILVTEDTGNLAGWWETHTKSIVLHPKRNPKGTLAHELYHAWEDYHHITYKRPSRFGMISYYLTSESEYFALRFEAKHSWESKLDWITVQIAKPIYRLLGKCKF